MITPPDALFRAWTERFDTWFAEAGSVVMRAEVNAPFYFTTWYAEESHPRYGRLLRLEPDRLVELTWSPGRRRHQARGNRGHR